jgi:hypothetical protein
MNNQDTVEDIAQEAIIQLTATVLTLRFMGEDELSATIAEATDELCARMIALGFE